LPPELLDAFAQEARARRRSPAAMFKELLEDLADARAADAAERRSKGKARVKAEDLYRECGL